MALLDAGHQGLPSNASRHTIITARGLSCPVSCLERLVPLHKTQVVCFRPNTFVDGEADVGGAVGYSPRLSISQEGNGGDETLAWRRPVFGHPPRRYAMNSFLTVSR